MCVSAQLQVVCEIFWEELKSSCLLSVADDTRRKKERAPSTVCACLLLTLSEPESSDRIGYYPYVFSVALDRFWVLVWNDALLLIRADQRAVVHLVLFTVGSIMLVTSFAANWRWSLLATTYWILAQHLRCVSPLADVCYEESPTNSCGQLEIRYYYDDHTRACRTFHWRGCPSLNGYGNIFANAEECVQACNGTG